MRRDQDRFVGNGGADFGRIEAAHRIDLNARAGEPLGFEELYRAQYGRMLDNARDDVIAAFAVCFGHAFYGQIRRFSAARSKYDFLG